LEHDKNANEIIVIKINIQFADFWKLFQNKYTIYGFLEIISNWYGYYKMQMIG